MHVRLIYSESLQKSRPPTLSTAFHLQTGVEKNRVKKSAGALKKKKSIVVSLWRCYMKIKPRRNFFKTHLQKKNQMRVEKFWILLFLTLSLWSQTRQKIITGLHIFIFFFPFTAGTAEKNKATLTLELQKPSDWTLALNVKSSMSQTE